MKRLSSQILPILLCIIAPALAWGNGFIVSSSERFNLQVGDAELILRSYDAFDEIDDINDVDSYQVSVGGGPFETIAPNPDFGGAFKRKQSFETQAELDAVRPQSGDYIHRIEINGVFTDVTITAPDISYESAIPINPLFTISGLTGVWAPNPNSPDGGSAFYFDPTDVEVFTVSMNAYSLLAGAEANQGDNFVSALFLTHFGQDVFNFDELGQGFGSSGDIPETIELTFTKGLPADGGEGSGALEFGFSPGDFLEFEGEFVNIFGLEEVDEITDAMKTFIFQTVTTMGISATPVPEPATYAFLMSAIAGVIVICRRRL